MTPRRLALCALATGVAACSEPVRDQVTPDAGQPPDGGDATVLYDPPEARQFGAYLPWTVSAILPGVASERLLVGTLVGIEDPVMHGAPPAEPMSGAWARAGLLDGDTSTGAVRVLDHDDGLPSMDYWQGEDYLGRSAQPITALVWVEPDRVFAGTANDRVFRGALGDDGTWTITSATVMAPGQTYNALVGSLRAVGGSLYVGTNEGLAVLDGATLATTRWVPFEERPWVTGIASAGTGANAWIAVKHGRVGEVADRISVVRVGHTEVQELALDGASPLSLLGVGNDVLLGVREANASGAIRRISFDALGVAGLTLAVSTEQLSTSSWGDFLPAALAYDPPRRRLYVGGRAVPSLTSIRSGGLAWLPVAADGEITGNASNIVDVRDPYHDLLPDHIEDLAVDGRGRLYVSGGRLCSEFKLGRTPLLRVEGEGPTQRVVLPWPASVRTIAIAPHDGQLWLGLRSENPGLRCDGRNIVSGVCRLRSDGACELWTPRPNAGDAWMTPTPGVTSIAFGDPARKELAFATIREVTYVRLGDDASVWSTQLDPGISLQQTKAAWGADGALWLGSEMRWSDYPNMDEDAINARGPLGLGYIETRERGRRRYSRTDSDQKPDDVPGLPSNTVWDVIPLGPKKALVACGIERDHPMFGDMDHLFEPANRRDLRGGLAVVEDRTVSVIPAPKDVRFGDVVALAPAPGGTFVALDAELGLFRIDANAKTATRLKAATWQEPERALDVAVSPTGLVAVSTTQQVRFFSLDGAELGTWGTDLGWVWTVHFTDASSLLVGTDQGLVRLTFGEATPLSLPAGPLLREPWPLTHECDGDEGCTCDEWHRCRGDLACGCGDNSCTCASPDPCVKDPGARGCACTEETRCADTLSCLCDESAKCACGLDPASCADGACTCREASECPNGWSCANRVCTEEFGDCVRNCTCATESGCPPGKTCQGGFAGFTCR